MADAERLGAFIRQMREQRQLSKRRVAQAMDYSPTAYHKLERGDTKNPEPETLGRLSQILRVPIADFFRAGRYAMFTPGGPEERELTELWERMSASDRRIAIALLRRLSGPAEEEEQAVTTAKVGA